MLSSFFIKNKMFLKVFNFCSKHAEMEKEKEKISWPFDCKN